MKKKEEEDIGFLTVVYNSTSKYLPKALVQHESYNSFSALHANSFTTTFAMLQC